MKKFNAIKTSLIILGILIIGAFTLSAFIPNNPDQEIIGTWISEDDSNWKIEFKTNGKCYWYYTGDDTEIFTYSISSTSPQCGYDVKVDLQNPKHYLSLIDQEDGEEYCYEILGVNNESLSLSTIAVSVNYMYFNKQ
jgi:hypothetical protein